MGVKEDVVGLEISVVDVEIGDVIVPVNNLLKDLQCFSLGYASQFLYIVRQCPPGQVVCNDINELRLLDHIDRPQDVGVVGD